MKSNGWLICSARIFFPLKKITLKEMQRKKRNQTTKTYLLFPFPSQRKKIPLTDTSNLKIYLILFSQGSTTGEMNFKIQRSLWHLGTCWNKWNTQGFNLMSIFTEKEMVDWCKITIKLLLFFPSTQQVCMLFN